MNEYIVNLEAKPVLEPSYKLFMHRRDDNLAWNPSRVSLCHSERRDSHRVDIYALCFELRYRHLYSANLLDFLQEHPDLIPDEWRDKTALFLGTIYKHRITGHNYVRGLYRVYERLLTCYMPLSGELRRSYCAVFSLRQRDR